MNQAVRDIIGDMVRKIAAEYAPERIILFGSQTSGTARADSDIDLLIIKDTTDRFIDRWTQVRRILTDRTRTQSLDTLILTPEELKRRLEIGDQFIAEIMEKGEVLYAA